MHPTNTFEPNVLNFDETLIFDLINVAPADILSVEWCYSLTIDGGQLVVDNDSDESASVTAMFGADLDVSSSTQNLLDSGLQHIFSDVVSNTNARFALAANDGDSLGDYDPSGPDGTTILGEQVTTTGSGFVNSAFLSQYAGLGTFALEVDGNSVIDVSGGGGIEFASTTADSSPSK
ncbi:choice-of-anchor E domain-containing protein [Akkermansiaceae bacterium]|nr:choice-of-anchor E domain-containing protein [Akkermansiaceae bacterium]MDB4562094.1 choice-of-anchor E domain-containing protein [Akkermansiaceae bacterium]MDB4585303.1 choice-of-anchor E domain-containing protein [Akkermansiaceae bacterium]MDB4781520.1 choice-of-anchor E domain-containing protein [Akkermansiaceae bacterium]